MEPTIKVNGVEYPMPTSFTLGESADMEKITGQEYDLAKGGALGLLAIAYVAVRRINPDVTVEDIRVLTDSDIEVLRDKDEKPVPPASAAASTGNGGSSTASSDESSGSAPDSTPEPTGAPA